MRVKQSACGVREICLDFCGAFSYTKGKRNLFMKGENKK